MYFNLSLAKPRACRSTIYYYIFYIYGRKSGGYSSAMTSMFIFHIIFVLILLLISNKPDKTYISLSYEERLKINHRSIGICLLFSLLTFGIYYYYWNFLIVKDTRKLNKQKGGLGEMLLITFIPFYDYYWVCSRGNRLSIITQNNRIKMTGSGISYLILNIFFLKIVTMCLIQDTLNNISDIMDENFVYENTLQPSHYTQPIYATTPPPFQNNIDILKQLNDLKNQGIISEEEFIQKKEDILNSIT